MTLEGGQDGDITREDTQVNAANVLRTFFNISFTSIARFEERKLAWEADGRAGAGRKRQHSASLRLLKQIIPHTLTSRTVFLSRHLIGFEDCRGLTDYSCEDISRLHLTESTSTPPHIPRCQLPASSKLTNPLCRPFAPLSPLSKRKSPPNRSASRPSNEWTRIRF